MNNFNNLVSERFSCRNYDAQRPVDRALLEQVLNAARLAPSAVNRQPWLFMVLTDEADLQKAAATYHRDWLRNAPAIIVAIGIHNQAWHRSIDGKDHTDVDLSIATEHICLAATDLGLGTCWVCNFDSAALSEALRLPDEYEPIAMIAIGHPAADCKRPEKVRKSLEEIVKWGSF